MKKIAYILAFGIASFLLPSCSDLSLSRSLETFLKKDNIFLIKARIDELDKKTTKISRLRYEISIEDSYSRSSMKSSYGKKIDSIKNAELEKLGELPRQKLALALMEIKNVRNEINTNDTSLLLKLTPYEILVLEYTDTIIENAEEF